MKKRNRLRTSSSYHLRKDACPKLSSKILMFDWLELLSNAQLCSIL
ncbi:hypothetical protein V9T40_008994 [Parthenolecanium corni]|uniref:Uncharacterized protein n=1 Tax=Parthenolecanium corni TaxID=536013 RepID=A0AAN9U0I8_9HEMI